MSPGVVKCEVRSDQTGPFADTLKLGDHVSQRFVRCHNKTTVARHGITVALGLIQTEQNTLEPPTLSDSGMLDQPDRRR